MRKSLAVEVERRMKKMNDKYGKLVDATRAMLDCLGEKDPYYVENEYYLKTGTEADRELWRNAVDNLRSLVHKDG